MRLFHGTTFENMLSILEHGFNPTNTNWTVSESDKTYFFTEDFFNKEYSIESDEELLAQAIPYTMDQARITLAVQNPKDYRGVVMVFESENMKNGSEIEPDYSCENMENCAVCLENPDMSGLVGVYIMSTEESSTRLFQLSCFLGRNYFPDLELNPIELALINSIQKSELYIISELNDYNEIVSYQFKKEFDTKKVAA
jgi:hypothetical protein